MQHLAASEPLNPLLGFVLDEDAFFSLTKTTKSQEFPTSFNYDHFCNNGKGGGNIRKYVH